MEAGLGIEDDEKKSESELVKDGSVDLKRTPVSYSATGRWNAAFFIMGVDMGERLAYFTIAASLFTYLTDVMHEGVAASAETVNTWSGVTNILPLVGGFLSDAYVGRYYMIITSSLLYLSGLALLIVSVSIYSLRPPPSVQKHATGTQTAVLFTALYMISCGSGGMKPSLPSFAADQFDYQHPVERKQKISLFNWYYFFISLAILMSNTVIVYVQGNVSWGAGFGIVASVSFISIFIFLCGTPRYRHKVPAGSPITRIAQVLVAAFRNRNLQVNEEPNKPSQSDFKWLDKAAIGEEEEQGMSKDAWKSCRGSQVEEVKQLARMVPVWLTVIIYAVTLAQGGTFFVKQSSTMDRNLSAHFRIPPASTLAIVIISTMITVSAYDRLLVPFAARITGMERGISMLQRIGVGYVLGIVGMIIGAVVEAKRLKVAQAHGLMEKPQGVVPMSVFWLALPNVVLGVADAFALVGLGEFSYSQVPENMRSLGVAFNLTAAGIGSFVSSLVIRVVNSVTGKMGQRWLEDNLNTSQLDNFYWLLVALNALNLLAFVFIARRYTYKSLK